MTYLSTDNCYQARCCKCQLDVSHHDREVRDDVVMKKLFSSQAGFGGNREDPGITE